LDAKAALGAEPQTARHPNAGADAARNHGRDGHRLRRSSEEWHGDAGAVVQVTDETQASALAHEVHDQPRGGLAFVARPPAAQQPAGVEMAANVSHVAIAVAVLDGALARGWGVGGPRGGPGRPRPR